MRLFWVPSGGTSTRGHMIGETKTLIPSGSLFHALLSSPLVQMFAGALISIATTVFLDAQRRPKLVIEIVETPPNHRPATKDPAGNVIDYYQAVGVVVKNVKRLPLNWPRQTVQRATAEISFLDAVTGANLCGRSMRGRWTDAAEPETASIEDGKRSFSGNQSVIHVIPEVDIPWGAAEKLDIAARFEKERIVYGWNNQNYYDHRRRYRNDEFSLAANRCLVKVVVSGSGERVAEVFALVNVDGMPVRLENPTRVEKALAREVS